MENRELLELQLKWYRQDRQRMALAKAPYEVRQANLSTINQKIASTLARLTAIQNADNGDGPSSRQVTRAVADLQGDRR
jgi:hypothetical protein